jgi:hypothetical protein
MMRIMVGKFKLSLVMQHNEVVIISWVHSGLKEARSEMGHFHSAQQFHTTKLTRQSWNFTSNHTHKFHIVFLACLEGKHTKTHRCHQCTSTLLCTAARRIHLYWYGNPARQSPPSRRSETSRRPTRKFHYCGMDPTNINQWDHLCSWTRCNHLSLFHIMCQCSRPGRGSKKRLSCPCIRHFDMDCWHTRQCWFRNRGLWSRGHNCIDNRSLDRCKWRRFCRAYFRIHQYLVREVSAMERASREERKKCWKIKYLFYL